MPIERAKLQLSVVTSGCALVDPKDGENIFPMIPIKTGSDDQKLQFSALNCRGTVGFCSMTMQIERAKLQLPVVTSGCKLAHQKEGEHIFPIILIKTEVYDRKLQISAFNWH